MANLSIGIESELIQFHRLGYCNVIEKAVVVADLDQDKYSNTLQKSLKYAIRTHTDQN